MPRSRSLHLALAALAAAALAGPAAPARAARFVPGEVVVTYASGAGAQAQAAAVGATGTPVGPPTRSRLVRITDGSSVRQAAARLRRAPGVVSAVPNFVAHAATSGYVPNDPGRGGPGGWQAVQWNFLSTWGVDAPDAWAHLRAAGAPGGRGVTIAVLDTGVAYANHGRYIRSPDFTADQFVRGYDFVSHDDRPDDRNGHGTHVAGTIAEATNNRVGLTGLAYGVRLMPVRVLDAQGEGDASTIAAGVRFAVRHGARIINLSLEFSSDVTSHEIPQLISALSVAKRRGVLVVAASGNEGHSTVAYPARARSVLSVGATTEHGCRSDFSNDGRGLDLVAPGGGADADLPDDPHCHPLESAGRDIFQITLVGSNPHVFGLPPGYEGTSMAAPHVSATAALIIASRILGPRPSPDALGARLRGTARPLGPQGYNTRYGWGLVNAAAATDPAVPLRPVAPTPHR
ncbi:MAG TPA: S8 family serine peptidase [Solirubrobacteraceae bacterium]|jgi:serine protease|nr:S8 family serine peptidase [Solirubrobacteraceae bacterium]